MCAHGMYGCIVSRDREERTLLVENEHITTVEVDRVGSAEAGHWSAPGR